jgi:hypothetical protein
MMRFRRIVDRKNYSGIAGRLSSQGEIHDASPQGSDVTQHTDALEAGVGVFAEELAVTRAAVEYLTPETYGYDLRYNA